MPKFVQKNIVPTVEAIQINWATSHNPEYMLKTGDWIVLHDDGTTIYTSDPDWFAANYQQVD